MAIRAYDETYISHAQDILGHAVDFAVMSLGLDPDAFANAFVISNASKQFEAGNPRYVAGMNGCELARLVMSQTHTAYTDAEDAMYLDKSPEYWSGWALAWYQWYTCRPFADILHAVPLSQIIGMYDVYHEMDLMQFADHMDSLIAQACPSTQLKIRRMNCGMSQSELAADSGVAIRQIQLFEQKQRNINNAAAVTLLQLSKSLHCRIEDLIEYGSIQTS